MKLLVPGHQYLASRGLEVQGLGLFRVVGFGGSGFGGLGLRNLKRESKEIATEDAGLVT